MQKEGLPLGYWVKEVDDLLAKGIDAIQSKFGLSRSDWQILNLIAGQSPVEKDALASDMKPFLNLPEVNNVLEKLAVKGLVSTSGNRYSLTATGKSQYSECLKIQKKFRQKAMNNISGEAYELTVATLKQIAENLK